MSLSRLDPLIISVTQQVLPVYSQGSRVSGLAQAVPCRISHRYVFTGEELRPPGQEVPKFKFQERLHKGQGHYYHPGCVSSWSALPPAHWVDSRPLPGGPEKQAHSPSCPLSQAAIHLSRSGPPRQSGRLGRRTWATIEAGTHARPRDSRLYTMPSYPVPQSRASDSRGKSGWEHTPEPAHLYGVKSGIPVPFRKSLEAKWDWPMASTTSPGKSLPLSQGSKEQQEGHSFRVTALKSEGWAPILASALGRAA